MAAFPGVERAETGGKIEEQDDAINVSIVPCAVRKIVIEHQHFTRPVPDMDIILDLEPAGAPLGNLNPDVADVTTGMTVGCLLYTSPSPRD